MALAPHVPISRGSLHSWASWDGRSLAPCPTSLAALRAGPGDHLGSDTSGGARERTASRARQLSMDGEQGWSGHAAGGGRSCRARGALGTPACRPPRSVCAPHTELQVAWVPGGEGAREEVCREVGCRVLTPSVCSVVYWLMSDSWLSVAGWSPDRPRLPISLV